MPRAHPFRARRPRAFTLLELLTVIAVLAVLVAILIPATGPARASAKQTACAANLRQLHVAVQLFTTDNRGLLPSALNAKGVSWAKILQEKYIQDINILQCPAAASKIDPVMVGGIMQAKDHSLSYGYNRYLPDLNADPKIVARTLFYAQRLILFSDSCDDGTANQYYVGEDLKMNFERHGNSVNIIHVDGSLARMTKAGFEALDASEKEKLWKPLR